MKEPQAAPAPHTPQPAPGKKAAAGKRAKRQAAATPPAAAPAAAKPSAAEEKAAKAKKPKLVRDSFTIPKEEYAVIESLKQRSGQLAQTTKKSELLRAGLKLLATLSDDALLRALQAVPSIKTGRPKAEASAAPAAVATAPAAAAKRAKPARK
ncbi:hypothetical protein ASF94_02070 [Acidovorax sp. Leaf160]|nr:hypothetical protein ASF94_02070 [Acidovorax sp. Leaf160]